MSPTGHLAFGFMAKHFAPKTSIFVLLFAAYLIDILYFIFPIFGIETADFSPWSHSLIMAIIWSSLTFVIFLLITKKIRSSLVIGLVVFSHWILDFLVWNNLPIGFNKENITGLGFYNRIGFDLSTINFDLPTIIATIFELTLLAFGLFIYIRTRRNLKKITTA
ncbi:MAG: hypothetical protein JW798_12855 [Prolixibacteraceae bacterium]|nr:hypothetical protein [Prolixibacteraceae bacterium]